MSQKEKLLEKIRNNPKNVSFNELDSILRWAGYALRPQKSGTSHFVYEKPGCPLLTIPKKNPLKEVYVKAALRIIDEYGDFDA